MAMFALILCTATIEMGVIVSLPLVLPRRGVPVSSTGVLVAVYALVLVVSRILPVPGAPFVAMARGYVLIAVGLLIGSVSSTLPLFIVTVIVWAIGDAVTLSHPYAVVAGLAEANSTGRYFAVFGLSVSLALVVGPVVVTQLLRFSDTLFLYVFAGVAFILASVQKPLARVVLAPA